jgi:hypothetical protein
VQQPHGSLYEAVFRRLLSLFPVFVLLLACVLLHLQPVATAQPPCSLFLSLPGRKDHLVT